MTRRLSRTWLLWPAVLLALTAAMLLAALAGLSEEPESGRLDAKFSWLDWNETELKGTFITYPERESVPENIKEQLIVELYSK